MDSEDDQFLEHELQMILHCDMQGDGPLVEDVLDAIYEHLRAQHHLPPSIVMDYLFERGEDGLWKRPKVSEGTQ